jgi:ribosome-binding protein aMBF1 (putative translation factor)
MVGHMAKDLLDELIDERRKKNADFPELVEANLRARKLVRSLAERRRKLGLSQTVVAARMGTSQSALARLEAGESDPRISTIERYAEVLGQELAYRARPKPAKAGTVTSARKRIGAKR